MSFFDELLKVLKGDARFFSDKGELLRNAVFEAAMKLDRNLIKLLLSNELVKRKFFVDVDGTLIFDKQEFGWIVNNRQFLPNSYTRFKNKIGLVNSSDELIVGINDVELVFPYKDCVLVGGQTEEDQKRDEIFLNTKLSHEEIDVLLSPKIYTNAKRYSLDSIDTNIVFKDEDNLIIKGNNLIAEALSKFGIGLS